MVYLNNLIFLITYQEEEVKIGFKVHQLNFNSCIMLVVLCCMGTSMSLHFRRSSYWSVDQVNDTWILLFDGVGLLHALPTLSLVFLFNLSALEKLKETVVSETTRKRKINFKSSGADKRKQEKHLKE